MAEPGELPDWLIQLRDQQFSEQPEGLSQPQEAAALEGQPPPQEPEAEVTEEPQEPADVLEGLREQIIQADEELEAHPKQTPLEAVKTTIQNFPSWQRLVLSVLLFLDVAVCGCMLLTMLGKVVFP